MHYTFIVCMNISIENEVDFEDGKMGSKAKHQSLCLCDLAACSPWYLCQYI